MGALVAKNGSDKLSHQSKTFFELEAVNIDGVNVKFSTLKGKKAFIIVNVACGCGYTTDHYQELMEMYGKYHSQGLEILAFPSNQFFTSESKSEPEIKEFVVNKFGVTFPMFSKVEVNGPNTHPVFVYLRQNSPLCQADGSSKEIPWNFGKFLLNSDGKVVDFFHPSKKPKEIIPTLNQLLGIQREL